MNMEHKLGRLPAMIVVFLTAAAALFLRRAQVLHGGTLFSWFCVAVVLIYGVYSFLLRPDSSYDAIAERSPVLLLGSVLAALAIAAASFSLLLERTSHLDLLLAVGGLVTACCWVFTGMSHFKGRRVAAPVLMIPTLFFAVQLICSFRDWSRDPMILDYCFDLLGLISLMCASYHLGGFCFDKGRRKITVFFCLCGIFFGAAAIASGRVRELALTGGSMVWLVCNLWSLLKPNHT